MQTRLSTLVEDGIFALRLLQWVWFSSVVLTGYFTLQCIRILESLDDDFESMSHAASVVYGFVVVGRWIAMFYWGFSCTPLCIATFGRQHHWMLRCMPGLSYVLCSFFVSFFAVVPISLYFMNESAIENIDSAVCSSGGLIVVFHVLGHLWDFFAYQKDDTVPVEGEP